MTEKRLIVLQDAIDIIVNTPSEIAIGVANGSKKHWSANEVLGVLADRQFEILVLLDKVKRVDAVEVVHGRWEWYTDRCEDLFLGCDDDYGWRCSKCKVPLDDEDDPEVMPTFRYCPNCGAKMDGERKDNDRKAD